MKFSSSLNQNHHLQFFVSSEPVLCSSPHCLPRLRRRLHLLYLLHPRRPHQRHPPRPHHHLPSSFFYLFSLFSFSELSLSDPSFSSSSFFSFGSLSDSSSSFDEPFLPSSSSFIMSSSSPSSPFFDS
eukprot:UN33467